MVSKIDCHALVFNPCEEESVKAALSKHPVNIHIAPAILGDIRAARLSAYRNGDAEYVSFIDPDDTVIDDSYARCLGHVADNPNLIGCYTTMTTRYRGRDTVQARAPWNKHTFINHGFNRVFIIRREILLDVLDKWYDIIPPIWGTDRAILALSSLLGDWEGLSFNGYVHNIHNDSVSLIMRKKYGEAEFYRRLTPIRQILASPN